LSDVTEAIRDDRQGSGHGRLDPQDPSSQACDRKTGPFEEYDLLLGESSFGPKGTPNLFRGALEGHRPGGASAKQDPFRARRHLFEPGAEGARGVNDGHVVALALSGRFAGDSGQPIETCARAFGIPTGHRSLGLHERYLIDAELGGCPHAVIELRAFRNGKHQDDACASGRRGDGRLCETDHVIAD